MTFAAIPWLSISINLLLVVFVIVCLLMTLVILMQRPKQEGLGAAFGGGVTDQVFGARTTNVLQRGTVYLGSLFFILSLTLAVLFGHQNKKTSILKSAAPAVIEEKKKPAEAVKLKSLGKEVPAVETAPAKPPTSTPEIIPAVPKTPAPAEPATPPAATAPTEATPPAHVTPPATEDKPGEP